MENPSQNLVVTGGVYDIAEACSDIPYVLEPGVSDTLTLTLVSSVAHSLRVSVVDTNGSPVVGATVDISRSGFSDTGITTTCGQTFFNSGLISSTDYEIHIEASGYTDKTITDVGVNSTTSIQITLD